MSFGAWRETALLMGKVLGADYDGGGAVDAPIKCQTLLTRAGIEVEKGIKRFVLRSLESRLIASRPSASSQWVLLNEGGTPANIGERVPFAKWLEIKITVTPPDVIVGHYAAGISTSRQGMTREAVRVGLAGSNILDIATLKAAREKRRLSEETGVELSILSHILAGKAKRPRAEHVRAIQAWVKKQ